MPGMDPAEQREEHQHMKLVITATPMYEDGTMGDDEQAEFIVPDTDRAAAGQWLCQFAEQWIGTTRQDDDDDDEATTCDAIDVTITRLREQRAITVPDDLIAPDVALVGEDGNAIAIMGRVERALKRAGNSPEVIDSYLEQSQAGDYDHLLRVAMAFTESDPGE